MNKIKCTTSHLAGELLPVNNIIQKCQDPVSAELLNNTLNLVLYTASKYCLCSDCKEFAKDMWNMFPGIDEATEGATEAYEFILSDPFEDEEDHS